MKLKPWEIALYATVYGGLAIWLGSSFSDEKKVAVSTAEAAKVHCYGDYVGQFGTFKGKWFSKEDGKPKVNGKRINLVKGDQLEIDYKFCSFDYDLTSKYHVPIGLTRQTQQGVKATVVAYRNVGRGYTVTVNTLAGNVDMAQSQYLKQYPYFVEENK